LNRGKKIRSSLLFLCFLIIYLFILGKIFYIQIIQKPFFQELGKQQYNCNVTTTPARAPIFDCNGKPLAVNSESLSAFILPKQIEEPDKLFLFLKKHFPSAYERWQQNKTKHFLYIKRRLSPEELALIKGKNIKDIKLIKEPCRFYPSETSGTIVGITDIDNNGLFGLEKTFNDKLNGKPTVHSLERDARSGHFYFNKKTTIQGKEGSPIYLTIDSDLQYLAYEELMGILERFEAKEGGIVIVDPSTGAILSSLSYPDFNPNDTKNINQEHTKNFPFTQGYEFGSVIKVFSAMAALEEGIITSEDLVDCEGKKSAYIDGMKVNTVSAQGVIPFSEVIEKTNNIGTAKVVKNLGPKLYDHYKKVRFGEKTELNFPGEQQGFITPPNKWSKRSIISLSFGYEIRVNMIQLAQAFGIIANEGRLVPLHLIKGTQKPPTEPLYSPKTIGEIKKILTNTVQRGTAHRARIKGYNIMGKTGTANLIENGKYNPNKNIFTFCGIVEKGNYKRVIITYVKESQLKRLLYSAMVAVPLFERVTEKMLIHDKII
jgi:cell division protein FtsI (penicillin-binding protein 3)